MSLVSRGWLGIPHRLLVAIILQPSHRKGRVQVTENITNPKKSIKSWKSSLQGTFSASKKTHLETIQSLDKLEESIPLSPEEANLRLSTKQEYLSTLKKEELYWYQRSRVSWLKAGDLNTKLFHRVANSRRRTNIIQTIKVGEKVLDSAPEIEEAIISHFRNLYSDPNLPRPSMAELEFMNLPTDKADWLERPFNEEEIEMAMKDLAFDNAPGPNGFPMAFFKTYWSTFKEDLKKFFEEFYR
ncbi:hypothetical protein AMTRI_Chr04g248890 [Amborella trichopoda]